MNLFKPKNLVRDIEGKITDKNVPSSWNKDYKEAVIRYLNFLDPLFEKARKTSEWDFVLTLLRFRGIQDAGWDAYENSLEAVEAVMDMEKRLRGDVKLNIFLWLYGHIVEASEPYETTANLLNICLDEAYRAYNFPKIKTLKGYRPQSPSEKINYLEKLAKKANMTNVINPMKEVYDSDLRNAVYHSDYAVYKGEVRLSNPDKIISAHDTLVLLNRALAYHEICKNLIQGYRSGYNKPKFIDVPHYFSKEEGMKAALIIRKGYGLIGVRSTWTKEEVASGKIPFYLGRYLPYEQKYIDKDWLLLPKNRVEYWNRFLRLLPGFLVRRLLPFIDKYFINR